ncbi:hypothetical protein PAXINDRAFT_14921 [Paxillus involutus ATCC 200175]|uniref:Uncharacterized protein n=1 Tax=Paxillus involutus ATCC 200175 TaxID=664439 RepID=A0A0C9TYE6_PAXIN|nr:hypothetical protein PAXINDRAFT_14921 [Paxillus involutus ATCC 200175]
MSSHIVSNSHIPSHIVDEDAQQEVNWAVNKLERFDIGTGIIRVPVPDYRSVAQGLVHVNQRNDSHAGGLSPSAYTPAKQHVTHRHIQDGVDTDRFKGKDFQTRVGCESSAFEQPRKHSAADEVP